MDVEVATALCGDQSSASSFEISESVDSFETALKDHPLESRRSDRYETTVRIRCTYFFFFSLALWVASAIGFIMQMFFFIIGTSDGLSPAQGIGIVLVPVLLLVTAVIADKITDLALDSMDSPCLRVCRAMVVTSFGSFMSRVNVGRVELALLLAVELVPLLNAFFAAFLFEGSPILNFIAGYFVGGCALAGLLVLTYLFAQVHVCLSERRDARMTDVYQSIGKLGEFKRYGDNVKNRNSQLSKSSFHAKSCLCSTLSAVLTNIGILIVFALFRGVEAMLVGQLIATLLAAMALRSCAPRLLGFTFWATFFFFLVLVGILYSSTGKELQSIAMEPMSLAPGADAFNEHLDVDLPIVHAPSYGKYSVCGTLWGDENVSAGMRFDILDLAALAYASSFPTADLVMSGLHTMFKGTSLEEFNVLEIEDAGTVGRWIVVEFPASKVRVLAVRGTSTLPDVYADLQVYGSIAVLQFMNVLTPVMQLLPARFIRGLTKAGFATSLFATTPIWDTLSAVVARHKASALSNGMELILTGHSLGGGLVGVAAAQHKVQGIGFSAPGLFYQAERMNIDISTLQRYFTIVRPSADVVPAVDDQRGMVQWIDCAEQFGTCHRLTKTSCELWTSCGDRRGRDWRRTCSTWYSSSALRSQ
eukprot:TRINITY_DN6640_c1_g1_i1.p1 TRINITY_DN6640_c1_g1~~TRINITY_DN6640_c1_g1_i1.p1  ORF type:complete len:646 (+),score=67.76 TRINITY_DN6640_c1_g1_i1:70-2007(+)